VRSVHESIIAAVQHIHPHPKSLLDVGCGDGSFTSALASVLPGTSITALDIAYPKRWLAPPVIRFVEGTVEELPFDPDSFDVVVSSLSMHHWNDKKHGISEISRVLRSEGHLVIGDPLLEGWLSNPFLGWITQKVDGGTFTTARDICAYCESAGLESVEISLIPNSMKALFLVTAIKV